MVCFDTTFLIDILKGNPKTLVWEKRIDSGEEVGFITTPSITELVKGVFLSSTKKNKKPFELERIEKLVNSLIVLDLDKESAFLAGRIEAGLVNDGLAIDFADVLIGAIALQNDETLITRNKKHFDRIPGLNVETY